MPMIAMLRHGPTEWNAIGRYQGHSDIPLSEEGRASLSGLRVPEPYRDWPWVSSPLSRARDTAWLVGVQAVIEPAVIEMSWGGWEGRFKTDLRAELGDAMRENEDRGLDFRPDGGESPREVGDRVLAWARSLETDTGVVAHKGVIRAVYARAVGWPMLGKIPDKLDWRCLHVFDVTPDTIGVIALNLPLEAS